MVTRTSVRNRQIRWSIQNVVNSSNHNAESDFFQNPTLTIVHTSVRSFTYMAFRTEQNQTFRKNKKKTSSAFDLSGV